LGGNRADANGNRVASSLHSDGYETGVGNRLLSDGTYNYEYDDEGNLISQTEIATGAVREFEWDYRNRLVAVIDKNQANSETQRVEYTYDAFNRRITKAVDTNPQDAVAAVVTHFVYNQDDVILEFVDNDGTAGTNEPVLNLRYLHGPAVDQVLAQEEADSSILWHLADNLGTIRDLVDNSGAVVNHITYDSFGNIISETDSTVDTRYLFTGREFDAETELYYYRSRYYDATLGSFLGEDRLGFAGGDTNLYRYVFNNPVSFSDPTGEVLPAIVIGGGILVGGIVGGISNVIQGKGFGSGFASGAIGTAVGIGVGAFAGPVAGGAAGGAAGNITGQLLGGKPFSAGELGRETFMGGALGPLGGILGRTPKLKGEGFLQKMGQQGASSAIGAGVSAGADALLSDSPGNQPGNQNTDCAQPTPPTPPPEPNYPSPLPEPHYP